MTSASVDSQLWFRPRSSVRPAPRAFVASIASIATIATAVPGQSAVADGHDAAQQCLENAPSLADGVGLLVGVTSVQSRLIADFSSQVAGALGDLLDHDVEHVHVQGVGCRGLLKAFALARSYLCAHPNKSVLIVSAERGDGALAILVSAGANVTGVHRLEGRQPRTEAFNQPRERPSAHGSELSQEGDPWELVSGIFGAW